MGFYKDCGGLFLFIICQINFLFQFFLIYTTTDEIDNKENPILIIHKIICYILLFLTVYSHLKTSFIDPGSITMKNNKEIIEFYYQVHEPLIKAALYITEKKTPEVIKRIILKNVNNDNENDNENEDDDNNASNSDKDDIYFEPYSSVSDNMIKIIKEKYKMKVTRCINCYVVRPTNTHHCSVCHKCCLDQDHHCPWVNNCIGLFNKKFFFLFLFYGFIEVIYIFILFFYYTLYKHISKIDIFPSILINIFAIIFGLIQAIVSGMLIWDQYDTILGNCSLCDFKKGILLERATVKQLFQIIFGGTFSYKWLFPFFCGGNKAFFEQLCLFLKLKEIERKKNLNKNSNNNDNNINQIVENNKNNDDIIDSKEKIE